MIEAICDRCADTNVPDGNALATEVTIGKFTSNVYEAKVTNFDVSSTI